MICVRILRRHCRSTNSNKSEYLNEVEITRGCFHQADLLGNTFEARLSLMRGRKGQFSRATLEMPVVVIAILRTSLQTRLKPHPHIERPGATLPGHNPERVDLQFLHYV